MYYYNIGARWCGSFHFPRDQLCQENCLGTRKHPKLPSVQTDLNGLDFHILRMFGFFFIAGLTDNYWVLKKKKTLQTIHLTNESQIYEEFKQLNKSPNIATKSGQTIRTDIFKWRNINSTAYEMLNISNYQKHAVLSQNQWALHPSQDNCYFLKINKSARQTSIYCRWGWKHIQPWDRRAQISQKSLKISGLDLIYYPTPGSISKRNQVWVPKKELHPRVCSTLW